MDGPKELSDILRDWEYDQKNNVRFLTTADGREIMQIRQPLGIEQYDLDGRPDGLHPEGENTVFDVYERKEREARRAGRRIRS